MTSIANASSSGDMSVTDVRARRSSALLRWHAADVPVVLTTLVVVALSCQMRWTTVTTTLWQCDEIPLLVRFTGLCGHVTDERSAGDFEPSLYTFRTGVVRSLSAPRPMAAIHTTTGFWANLTLHLFGVNPTAGRLAPLVWSIVAILVAAWGGWMVGHGVFAACSHSQSD